MTKKPDEIFKGTISKIVDFKFDEKVANVFEDMLRRSIPGYSTIISIIGMLTKLYHRENTNLYDLGTSLGAAALSIRNNIDKPGCRIIAVDNSEPMIKKAAKFIERDRSDIPVNLLCEDIRQIEIQNSSVVTLNFTLQFIPVDEREEIIRKIFNGLVSGGILILSEKIIFEDKDMNNRQIERYHDFKKLHGYSELEISRKRDALEKVLIPETLRRHTDRLQNAGFNTVDVIYQCFNFITIAAVK